MAVGPWIQPDDPPAGVFGFGVKRFVWSNWGITTPIYSPTPMNPSSLFAQPPEITAQQVGSNPFTGGWTGRFEFNPAIGQVQGNRSRGMMMLLQFGDQAYDPDASGRPTDLVDIPPEWEWPDGATDVEIEGPGTWLGPTTVNGSWSVNGAVPAGGSLQMPVVGRLVQMTGFPTLDPGSMDDHVPTINDVVNGTVRDTLDAGVTTSGQIGLTNPVVSFQTDAWPITVMAAPSTHYTGAFAPTAGPTDGTWSIDTLLNLNISAPYRYPRYRFVFPGGGLWPLRQRQSLVSGSWPLRQRQNGAHSGSWPLRQRQRGV